MTGAREGRRRGRPVGWQLRRLVPPGPTDLDGVVERCSGSRAGALCRRACCVLVGSVPPPVPPRFPINASTASVCLLARHPQGTEDADTEDAGLVLGFRGRGL